MVRNDRESEQERARLNRMDIINSKLSRRDMFKYGLLTAGGLLVAKSGLSIRAAGAGTLARQSPTKAWAEPLPIRSLCRPTSNFDVSMLKAQCSDDPKEVRRADHQLWDTNLPVEGYELKQAEEKLVVQQCVARTENLELRRQHRPFPPFMLATASRSLSGTITTYR